MDGSGKRKLDMKRWDNPQTDSIELYFYVEYGIEVTDAECIATYLEHHKEISLPLSFLIIKPDSSLKRHSLYVD